MVMMMTMLAVHRNDENKGELSCLMRNDDVDVCNSLQWWWWRWKQSSCGIVKCSTLRDLLDSPPECFAHNFRVDDDDGDGNVAVDDDGDDDGNVAVDDDDDGDGDGNVVVDDHDDDV